VVIWQNFFILFTEPLDDIHGLLETPLTDPMHVANSEKSFSFLSEPLHFINETYRVSSGSRGIKPEDYIIKWYEK
jgi:hypothetical protein